MPVIRTEIFIQAPIERCFDLARDVNAHTASTSGTRERVVFAPASGLLELGDEVEFEAVHFGVRQRLRSKITEYERPTRFVDEMQKGAFARVRHEHSFDAVDGGTWIRDTFDFASPLGPLGVLADRLFLTAYLRRFLERRGLVLKRMAEETA